MSISIPELLVKDGFISPLDREHIERLSASLDISFLKVALSYGFISRKNYGRSMANAGYEFQAVRELECDPNVLKEVDLAFAHAHLAIPLRVARR